MLIFYIRLNSLAIALFGLALIVSACSIQKQSMPQLIPQMKQSWLNIKQGQAKKNLSELPKVALLLPMSGQATIIGRAMRNAAELALFDKGSDNFTLSFYDTVSDPQTAARMAELAINEGADMIIGPLFSDEVLAIRPITQISGIPVLSFSNDRSIASNGVWVFGILPSEQIKIIVRYAAMKGYRRIGILAPFNTYGFETTRAAIETAKISGASIHPMRLYTPESSDSLSDMIKSLAASRDYDAVLLPEGGQKILNLAALMAYHDIDSHKVKFLGSSLWANPALLHEPTLIGGWFAAPDPGNRKPFLEHYRSVYGNFPEGLASLAYDTVSLVAILAQQPNKSGFSANYLTQPSGFNGVDGPFRLLEDGTNQRSLAILQLTTKGIKVIEPTSPSFLKPSY
ncbi:extracellular ligand-binding receptor [Candidatus Endolissoclinum faulkneri L5]|uniref:Extracellular ligand-binding receptor n=1 Tax=Candidatus Endolissoclinum faulkneri L5 TaxID=1401328 RepID=V9TTB8_9PROT|nr:penicillin-binding protein activator [Candidatus Endolissoclinum faulkneri]AHC73831.1 extracellular ligand-binding receptor [Candidatus Endolissoclinum faulkneri L5]